MHVRVRAHLYTEEADVSEVRRGRAHTAHTACVGGCHQRLPQLETDWPASFLLTVDAWHDGVSLVISNANCMHLRIYHSSHVAAHCGIVCASGLMPLLGLLSLALVALWCGRALAHGPHGLAVLARADKVMCVPRVMKYFLLFRRPSTFGQLAAKLERRITTNRLDLTSRTD